MRSDVVNTWDFLRNLILGSGKITLDMDTGRSMTAFRIQATELRLEFAARGRQTPKAICVYGYWA